MPTPLSEVGGSHSTILRDQLGEKKKIYRFGRT